MIRTWAAKPFLNSLLDTNIISEWKKPRPDAGVLAWLRNTSFDDCYLSVVTLSEIRVGVDRLAPGRRRDELEHWLTWELPLDFGDRLINVTADIADVCGVLRARSFREGRPMPVIDAYLAATAEVRGLTVVTRNVKDFEAWGGSLFNPWTDA